MRKYEPKDASPLETMLALEDIPVSEMGFSQYETWVLDEEGEIRGFFTMRQHGDYPYLVHFCVKRNHRGRYGSFPIWKKLMNQFKNLIHQKGFKKVIIGIEKKNERLVTGIRRFLKKEPYGTWKGLSSFFMEV